MRNLIKLLFCLILIPAIAQVKLGKVSKEDFITQSSLDAEAPAELAYDYGNYELRYLETQDKLEVKKRYESRVIVFDKDKIPDSFLNIEIPYFSESEKVIGVKASTFNLDNGQVIETKLSKSDLFDEKVSKYQNTMKFAFPNVKNGSILELEYEIITSRFYDLGTWYFQNEIPVKYNVFRFTYPEIFNYSKDIRGEQNLKPKTVKLGHNRTVTDEYIIKNLPAIRNEPFVLNSRNLLSQVRYELNGYDVPGVAYKNFSSTWEKIMLDLNNDEQYGKALSKNSFLDAEAAQFSGISDLNEKLVSIFQYVQKEYTWDEYGGLYPENGLKKLQKDKSGNATDLNFMLISLLRKNGFNANPVVLSTVSNGILNYNPSLQKLNYTIAAVVKDNQVYLMDASDKYSNINMLPLRTLNYSGFMILPDGKFQQVNLVNNVVSEIKNVLNYKLEDGVLKGKFVQTKNNYFAMIDLREKMEDETNFTKNYLADFDADFTDSQFNITPKGDLISYSNDFECEKYVDEIGNKLMIKPLIFLSTDSNRFKFSNKERKYPLEFATPFIVLNTVLFTIPEIYEVESLPAAYEGGFI